MSTERFGGSWWGRRWVEALERLATAWQSRLPRGRDYATKGHVISLSVQPGKISARVQGSRSKPYTTTIEVPVFREPQWADVIKPLASQARFPAQLLIGQMPPDIEKLFADRNLHLFPVRNSEMLGSCSCPDKARPCKHIAAVHYAFGEALDRDPFLLFQVRGADRDVLIRGLRRAWFGDEAVADAEVESDGHGNSGIPIAPLSADRFNRSPDQIDTMSFTMRPSEQPLVIMNRLGAPSSWQLPITIHQLLGPVYEEAANRALEIALAEMLRDELPLLDDDFDDEPLLDDLDDDEDDDDDDDLDEDDDDLDDDAPAPAPASDHSMYRSLQSSVPADLGDEGPSSVGTAMFLPGTIGNTKRRVVAAPEPEPERSSVLIRKGVAAVGRRHRKNRSTGSLKPLAEQELPPSPAPGDGPMIRRPGSDRKGRRIVDDSPAPPPAPLISAPPAPDPNEAQPIRRRRVVVPEEPAPTRSAVDDEAVERRKVGRRRRATISADVPTLASSPEVLEREAREALDRGDGIAALVAARSAWDGGPTIPRFLAFMAASDATGEAAAPRDELASVVIDRLIEAETPGTPPELLLVLAAGRYESAAALISTIDDPTTPAALEVIEAYVPFALMAAIGGAEVPPRTSLSRLWDALYARGEDAFPTMENPPAPVGAWLEWALSDAAPGDEVSEVLVDTARNRVQDLQRSNWAGESDENAQRAIRLAAAVGEALVLIDGVDHARMYMDGVRDDIAPHRRLVKALERIERDSALLPR